MSLDLADYTTAASFGYDLAAASRTLRELTTWDDRPLVTSRIWEDEAPARRSARPIQPTFRETVKTIADEDLAGRVAEVPLGRAPKVTGTQLQALLALGAGAAVLLAEDNSTRVVEEFDVEDPDDVPVVLWGLVKTKCDPDEDEEGNKPPAVRPVDLAQTLTRNLRRGYDRCALNPAA